MSVSTFARLSWREKLQLLWPHTTPHHTTAQRTHQTVLSARNLFHALVHLVLVETVTQVHARVRYRYQPGSATQDRFEVDSAGRKEQSVGLLALSITEGWIDRGLFSCSIARHMILSIKNGCLFARL